MNITEKITMLNNHLEMVGSDRRYWITDNRIFVCYNATTDEDDIDNPERKQQEKEQQYKKAEEQQRQIERYKAETIVKIETTKTEEELKQVWTSIPKEWQPTFKEQIAKQKESFNK
mgnify:CR=1 FL=1